MTIEVNFKWLSISKLRVCGIPDWSASRDIIPKTNESGHWAKQAACEIDHIRLLTSEFPSLRHPFLGEYSVAFSNHGVRVARALLGKSVRRRLSLKPAEAGGSHEHPLTRDGGNNRRHRRRHEECISPKLGMRMGPKHRHMCTRASPLHR